MNGLYQKRSRGGFTLIELLVVMAIILMLAGLLFPVLGRMRRKAKETRAAAEVKQLETAWRAVYSDFRGWPTASGIIPGVNQDMSGNHVGFLQGGNSRGVIYMEFDAGSTNSAGAFVDPWWRSTTLTPNNIYQIALGSEGMIHPPQVQNGVAREVGAWARGADGVDDGTMDGNDVMSWDVTRPRR
jgi:prepilin-type N-terminal cleavage/methylation domain-containing protein